jgi:spermidine synthase
LYNRGEWYGRKSALKTRVSSHIGYVVFVGVILGFVSAVFVATWSHMVPRFAGNSLVSTGWVVCSMLVCVLAADLYFGPRTARVSSRLRFLASMQIGLGISAMAAVELLPVVATVAGALGSYGSITGTAIAGLLTFGILFVPCFLMGGILTFAASLAGPGSGDRATGTGRLALPVLGGYAAGAWLSTFSLVPSVGYWRTLLGAAILAAAAGVVGLLTRDTAGVGSARRTDTGLSGAESRRFYVSAVASAVFVAGTLTCTILWTRLLAIMVGRSVYAGAVVLTVCLGSMAVGSAVSLLLARSTRVAALSLVCLSAVTGIYWLAVSHSLDHIPSVFLAALKAGPLTWNRLVAGQLRVSLLTVAVPSALAGASLPLLGRWPRRGSSDRDPDAGGRAAIGIAALGGFLAFAITRSLPAGSLTFRSGLAIAPWFCLASAVALAARTGRPLWLRAAVSLSVIVAGIALTSSLPRWRPDILTSGVFNRLREIPALEDLKEAPRGSDLVYYGEDGDVVTSVERSPDGMALKTNGRISASTGEDLMPQILTAQIPLLIHSSPRRVLLVGLGTGMTLASVETHAVGDIVCVEPVATDHEAAQVFSHFTRNATADGRLRLITADPESYLLSHESFDVVILEPPSLRSSRPGRLLTTEFTELVRSRLAAGGVVCQRLSAKGLPAGAFKAAVRAFTAHFPNVSLWWAGAGEFLLVGSMKTPDLEIETLDSRMSEPEIARDLGRLGIADDVGVIGCYTMDRASLLEFAGDGPLNTDDNGLIDYDVPRILAVHDPTETLKAIDSMKQHPMAAVRGLEEESDEFKQTSDRLDRFMKARTLYVNSLASAWSGRLSEAAAELEQAAGLSPENGIFLMRLSDYYIALSRSLNAAGRREEAIDAARQAVEVNPTNYRAYYHLATLEMTRNGTLAIGLLNRATELNPGYVPAYLLKAEGELASGDPDEASSTVGEVLSVEPFNVHALHLRALSLIRRGMLVEGLEVLENALDLDPENVEVMNALAYTLFMENNLDRAEDLYQHVLRLDPDDLTALNNYATVLAEKGDYREAIRMWTRALGLDPGNRNIIDNIEEARQRLRR